MWSPTPTAVDASCPTSATRTSVLPCARTRPSTAVSPRSTRSPAVGPTLKRCRLCAGPATSALRLRAACSSSPSGRDKAFDGDRSTVWAADRYLRPRPLDRGRIRPRPRRALDRAGADRDRYGVEQEVEIDGVRARLHPGVNRVPLGLRNVRSVRVQITKVRQPRGDLRGSGGFREIRIPGFGSTRGCGRRSSLGGRWPVATSLTPRSATCCSAPAETSPSVGTGTAPARCSSCAGIALTPSGSSTGSSSPPRPAAIPRRRGSTRRWRPLTPGWTDRGPARPRALRFVGTLSQRTPLPGLERVRRPAGHRLDRHPGSGLGAAAVAVLEPPRDSDPLTRAHAGGERPGAASHPCEAQRRSEVHSSTPGCPGWDGAAGPAPAGPGLRLTVLSTQPPAPGGRRERALRQVGIASLEAPGLEYVDVARNGSLRASCNTVRLDAGGRTLGLKPRGALAKFDAGRPLRAESCGRALHWERACSACAPWPALSAWTCSGSALPLPLRWPHASTGARAGSRPPVEQRDQRRAAGPAACHLVGDGAELFQGLASHLRRPIPGRAPAGDRVRQRLARACGVSPHIVRLAPQGAESAGYAISAVVCLVLLIFLVVARRRVSHIPERA